MNSILSMLQNALEPILKIVRFFIPDDERRAKVLAWARHSAQWVAGGVFAWVLQFLTSNGVDHASALTIATAIASAVGALIVGLVMALFALLDVNKVATTEACNAKGTAEAISVAASHAPDPVRAANAAVAALRPTQAAATIAALQAGDV